MSIANGQVASAADVLVTLTANGLLRLTDLSELIVSAGGAVTATKNLHKLTPASGNDDDLDTINFTSPAAGQFLLLTPSAIGYNIRLRSGIGNIVGPAGRDVMLNGHNTSSPNIAPDLAILMYDGTQWRVVGGVYQTAEQTLFNFQNFS